MKYLLLLLACISLAQTSSAPNIPELEALQLENVSLKLDLLTKEAEALHRDRNEIIRGVCAAASIPIQECTIDVAKRIVSRKPLPPPKDK